MPNIETLNTSNQINLIYPSWDVSSFVHAFTTTRLGGVSSAPYAGLNLGLHVGDKAEDVEQNRQLLVSLTKMPIQPKWLNQTHSTCVATLYDNQFYDKQLDTQNADAIYTNQLNQVCAVLTADCLPVLFYAESTYEIAAAHAGWRGLCDGILEATVNKFIAPREDIKVWLGPAIGPNRFEVGEDVLQQFMRKDPVAREAFVPIHLSSDFPKVNQSQTKYLANIYQLAKQRLNPLGIVQITGGNHCTVSQSQDFYSYRREGITGRMVTCIWLENPTR